MIRGNHLRITRESKPGYILVSGKIVDQSRSWLLVQHYDDRHPQDAHEIVALSETYNPNVVNNIGRLGGYYDTVEIHSVAVAIGRLRALLGNLPVESRTRLVPIAACLSC